MKTIFLLISGFLLLMQGTATASDISTDILAKGSVSWDGGAVEYTSGKPEITIQKIAISTSSEEVTLAVHCHTMPLAAYVVKGSVRVVKPSGENKLFQAGDAFIEVMNTWHKGVIIEDTELIVFYAGNADVPLSVKKDGNSQLSGACK